MGPFKRVARTSLHALLEVLADSKPRMKGLAREREGLEWERSSIMSGLKRELSLAGTKTYSAGLLGRKAWVGEEHRQAPKMRAWIKREEGRRKEESRTHWVANVQRTE